VVPAVQARIYIIKNHQQSGSLKTIKKHSKRTFSVQPAMFKVRVSVSMMLIRPFFQNYRQCIRTIALSNFAHQ